MRHNISALTHGELKQTLTQYAVEYGVEDPDNDDDDANNGYQENNHT